MSKNTLYIFTAGFPGAALPERIIARTLAAAIDTLRERTNDVRPRSSVMYTFIEVDTFTRHYLTAALWADAPDDMHFDLNDINLQSIARAAEDCRKFQYDNKDDLAVAYEEYVEMGLAANPDAGSPEACAGHDFWLTRQRHGSGFWDRGLTVGQALTTAAQVYPAMSLTVDGGTVHIE